MRQLRLTPSLIVFLLFVVIGLLGPWVAPADPNEQLDTVAGRYRPPATRLHAVHFEQGFWRLAERVERLPEGLAIERLGVRHVYDAASIANLTEDGVADQRFYLFGSDGFGRDVFSRWLHGARVSLSIALLSILIAMLVGVGCGALAAMGGRWVDGLLMRLVDGLLTFPWIFLIITLGALVPANPWSLIAVLGATAWMAIARLTRGELMTLKQRGFVLAARAAGASRWRIFHRHLLPNALPTLVVAATLRVGNIILVEAALSFLGLGVQPPAASWGNMIADGRDTMLAAWWISTLPGLSLVATVLAINLLSDNFRDALDPRQRSLDNLTLETQVRC